MNHAGAAFHLIMPKRILHWLERIPDKTAGHVISGKILPVKRFSNFISWERTAQIVTQITTLNNSKKRVKRIVHDVITMIIGKSLTLITIKRHLSLMASTRMLPA
jgi:riboflavin synthase alpha subunit